MFPGQHSLIHSFGCPLCWCILTEPGPCWVQTHVSNCTTDSLLICNRRQINQWICKRPSSSSVTCLWSSWEGKIIQEEEVELSSALKDGRLIMGAGLPESNWIPFSAAVPFWPWTFLPRGTSWEHAHSRLRHTCKTLYLDYKSRLN